ncbi:titin isoform X3 [Zophobas morio]|uniref:titin isoform X3 n=1 Tax=Zophobas morio TaxID=2755281 RepID=UPI003082A819
MTERLRSASTVGYQCPKMENDLSPRKTMLVLVIVVGCFAVLWPKVFYPMLVGSANQHIKPSPIDKTTGCCDVISETDVNTIKIMTELCGTIINSTEDKPLSGKEIVQRCRQEVLDTCGIDISVVLQEQVRLGQTVKQILDEIRSLNGSLCLKYNYGLAPWRLGVPHRVTVKAASGASNIRQERPMHLRSELVHPAFRERGRAIPQPQVASPARPPPRVVEGRPGPIPGMRPTIGGAGHVVPPSKQGTSSMSVIMPIYTIGIVIFFTYTLMKILFKKQPDNVGGTLYPQVDPDPHFRKEVFESESSRLGPRLTRENIASKLGDAELDQLRHRLRETELAMERIVEQMSKVPLKAQDLVNGTLSNGDAVKPQDEEQPTVKVLGMETTASCEGGKKWSRPESPVLPTSPPPPPAEPVPPPQEIYLEGALPAQSHLLVADSAIEPEPATGEDPAVVLSGKMTLSVISLDSENGVEETIDGAEDVTAEKETTNNLEAQVSTIQPVKETPAVEEPQEQEVIEEIPTDDGDNKNLVKLEDTTEEQTVPTSIQESTIKLVHDLLTEEDVSLPLQTEETSFNIEEETEKLLANLGDDSTQSSILEKDIEEFLQKIKEQSDFQPPTITLESEDVPHTLEVESLEKEVDDLIQEALESVQQREVESEILPNLSESTNEINDDVNETKTENVPETSVMFLQIESDALEVEKEKSPKFDLKQEISNEIEKLIQEVKDLPIIEQKVQEKEETKKTVDQIEKEPNLDAEKLKVAEETQALSNKVEEISQRIEEITSRIGDTSSQAESQIIEAEKPVLKKDVEVVAEAPKSPILDIPKQPEIETRPLEEKVEPTTTKVEENVSSTNDDVQEVAIETSNENTEVATPKVEENLSSNREVTTRVDVEPKVEKVEVEAVAAPKQRNDDTDESKVSKTGENVSVSNESEDEELGSDEELVEEIEEIVYEEESGDEEEEEIEIEVEEEEESEEEIPNERNTTRTESSSAPRVNGERSEDLVEESKYTTVSGATAAENEISDEDLIDNEEVEEEEEEIIEVEEEVEEEEYVNEEGNDVNHVSGESEPEL